MNRETPRSSKGFQGLVRPQSLESRKVISQSGPGDDNFVATSSQLNDGLKTCRAVLSNYRSLLADETGGDADQAGFNETSDGDDDERSSN